MALYLPARFRTSRRYPSRDPRRRGLPPLLGARTVLDNLIHRLEIAPLVAALPARRRLVSTRTIGACASWPGTSRSSGACRCARAGGAGSWGVVQGGRLARRRSAIGPLGSCCPVGLVRLHRHRPGTAGTGLRAGGALHEPVPRPPGRVRARRQLRHLRVADLREPPSCRCSRTGMEVRYGEARTATTGRSATGVPPLSTFPAPSGWSTSEDSAGLALRSQEKPPWPT